MAKIAWLFAMAILIATCNANGGVHPDLERQLRAKATGELIPVIVELEERVNPGNAAANAPARDRRAQGKAVVQALKDVAQRTQGPIRAQLAQESSDDARNVRPLWVVNAIALEASAKTIDKLAKRHDVREVRLDRSIAPPQPRRTMRAKSSSAPPAWGIAQIHAPEAWSLGYDGTGIVVGSFDTGVDGTHPDLAPRYRGNDAISWFDPYGQHDEPYDGNGHGTHTTGTMLGGDFSGFQIGVAPGARWIAAKGWNNRDNATASAFHAIFEWFLAPGGDSANAPDVVNSSWGMDPPSCDPEFVADVAALRAAGIVPVFSSGNSGPDPGTVLAPGSYATAFAVGATDFSDDIAEFSSQGPSACGGILKPDVSAPGIAILSSLPGGIHLELDGTSMAAPHVSGAVAILRQISPGLTVDEVEAALVDGSVDRGAPGADNEFGAGRVDVLNSASLVLGIPVVGVTATTPTAAEAGLVPGRFTVTRRGSTSSSLTLGYTVSGTATPGSDYVALPGTVTIPVGAASATITVTPIDDFEVELTETVVLTLTANPAYLASPAQATVSITSDEIPPDLVIAALTTPPTGGAGLPITLSDTTRNQGAAAAGASVTRYYLSSNAMLDASDVPLGSRAVPALAAGASNSGSATVTLPAGLASGTYYILAKADGNDALVETQEENNVAYATLLIGPDLQVSSFTAPTDGGAGLPLVITDTTRNAGAGPAAASTTTYFLSTDSTLDAADAVLGNRSVPTLAASASDTGSVTVTIPSGTATGTYTLFARADSANVVSETYENNNTTSRTLRVGPDLTVTALTVPATAGIATVFTATDTTRNAGGGSAPATTTRYYLSLDGLPDAGDLLLGSRAVAALAPGATDTGSASLTIPAGTAGGAYFIVAVADGAGAVAETVETNNFTNRSIVVGADLTVSAFAAPTDGGAGLSITLTDTTRNQGAGTTAPTTTSFYLSTDGIFDAGDVLLGSRAVPSLAASATSSGSVSVTIPAATATGTYTLFARADSGDVVSEAYENNNLASRTIRVGPDLVVSAFTAPTSAGAGAPIALTDTTRNAGAGNSPATTTRFYLSSDWLLDASDVLLATRAVPALAAGASDTGSVTATIPAGTPGGAYYLIAVVDAENAVAETQETNNTFNRNLLIGPDLGVSTLTAPSDAGAGLPLTITDTTRNTGGGSAPSTTTGYYLSADATLDAGDLLVGSRVVPALAAGASDTGSVTVTLPAGIATGTYTLFARADSLDAVAETYENNNTTSRTLRVGPDLTVTALTVPASAGAGASISVTDSTRNQGGGSAAASSTRYLLSTDGAPSADDVALGSRAVPSLAPGGADTATVTLTIPAGTAAGSYFVIAVADGDGVVAETVESNNFTNRSILVGSDLVLSSFTAPNDGGAGLSLTLGDTTRNQGAGTTPASTTSYYLSANATLDAADALLGSRAVPALASGASDSGTVSVTLPAGTTTGTWYLFARADSGDVVSELSEINNTLSRTIRVGPDLQVSNLVAPVAAGAGDPVSVTVVTQNIGGGAAPASTTQLWLSSDWILSSGDVLLGTRAVGPLAPGASDTATVTLTIPAGTPGGTQYILAVADGESVVVETQEGNNLASRSILVGADLQVSSFTVPSDGGAGLSLVLTDTTRNAGAGTAAASTTSYYLSVDATLDAGDMLLGSRAVPALAGGASDTGSVTVTIPAATATGTYTVFARVDSGGVVPETYENNNTTSRSLRIGPDLVVTSLTGASSGNPGGTIVVNEATGNTGGGSAPASVTRYLLSSDGLPSAGDVLLTSRTVAALAPGGTDTAAVTLTIPAGTATGWWYVIAVADGDGTVPEVNETNNFRSRSVYVSP